MKEGRRLFPSFFLAGFECSTPVTREGRMMHQLQATQHDRFAYDDYRRLLAVNIHTVREGAPWNLIEQVPGAYDFAPIQPLIDAGRRTGMLQIWDLFHYGYPQDIDPFSPALAERFARFCEAFVRYVRREYPETRFYTPINEISFFSWAGAEVGWWAPFQYQRGWELKKSLVRAAIAGMNAIWNVQPEARFVHPDPLIHVAVPEGHPELAEAAATYESYMWHGWDMLCGRLEPELGGTPRHLDIIGVNVYWTGQYEYGKPLEPLDMRDPRRKPLREQLLEAYRRYERPMIIGETACWGEWRAPWLRYVVDESLAAMAQGVDLHGICLYPIIDFPQWHTGRFDHWGLWDLVRVDGHLERVLVPDYHAELLAAQERVAAALGAEAVTGLRG
jgi:hypothetical protein